MGSATLHITETFVVEYCCNCGIAFAITEDLKKRRLEDHESFYCPRGHGQHYTAESEAEKARTRARQAEDAADRLRQQLERRGEDLRRERKSHASTKGELTKVKKRVAHGVCPCCNRTFKQVDAHMKRMHPGFVDANG